MLWWWCGTAASSSDELLAVACYYLTVAAIAAHPYTCTWEIIVRARCFYVYQLFVWFAFTHAHTFAKTHHRRTENALFPYTFYVSLFGSFRYFIRKILMWKNVNATIHPPTSMYNAILPFQYFVLGRFQLCAHWMRGTKPKRPIEIAQKLVNTRKEFDWITDTRDFPPKHQFLVSNSKKGKSRLDDHKFDLLTVKLICRNYTI